MICNTLTIFSLVLMELICVSNRSQYFREMQSIEGRMDDDRKIQEPLHDEGKYKEKTSRWRTVKTLTTDHGDEVKHVRAVYHLYFTH